MYPRTRAQSVHKSIWKKQQLRNKSDDDDDNNNKSTQ